MFAGVPQYHVRCISLSFHKYKYIQSDYFLTSLKNFTHLLILSYSDPTEQHPRVIAEEKDSLRSRYVGSFLLERRSLVCFKEDMYNVYLHGIDELTEDCLGEKNILNSSAIVGGVVGGAGNGSGDLVDEGVRVRGTRVSLTIRHFPKVLKIKFGRK